MTLTIGVDVGGTKVAGGVVDEKGVILAQHRVETPARDAEATTTVTYQLVVDVRMPLLGMMKRKAEKVIIDTALKELKKRVEG